MRSRSDANAPTVLGASTDEEILHCADCMHELRPSVSRDSFVERVRAMHENAYRLAYIDKQGKAIAVAGYRVIDTLFAGRALYVDDLVTSNAVRSKGYGATMIEWLCEKAIAEQCNMIHLDSGTQRVRAHKFYLQQDFEINCFHFAKLFNGQ